MEVPITPAPAITTVLGGVCEDMLTRDVLRRILLRRRRLVQLAPVKATDDREMKASSTSSRPHLSVEATRTMVPEAAGSGERQSREKMNTVHTMKNLVQL